MDVYALDVDNVLDVVEEPAGLWSCATLTYPTGYLCNQSMMRSAAIILDTEECFHTGGRELLVIKGRAGS